jgi:cytochrome c553
MSIIKNLSISFFLVTAGLMALPAHASGDAERGALLGATCLGCHGIPGYRNAYPSYRVPKLGGQHEDYIGIGLNGYKSKGRPHPTMQAQADGLSDQDIKDLAAYFSKQSELASGNAKDNAQIARGQEKSTACAACHGATGVSALPNWPILAGQHEDYLRQALTQYKLGTRTDPVMAGQVIALTEEDIKDLAAYFAAQPGLVSIK